MQVEVDLFTIFMGAVIALALIKATVAAVEGNMDALGGWV